MVYERVRSVATGTLSGSNVAWYSERVIDGRIAKVWLNFISGAATGSIFVNTSGTILENILTKKSFSADTMIYPRAKISDTSAGLMSGSDQNIWTEIAVRDVIQLVGSGIGAGSQFEATIYYY